MAARGQGLTSRDRDRGRDRGSSGAKVQIGAELLCKGAKVNGEAICSRGRDMSRDREMTDDGWLNR